MLHCTGSPGGHILRQGWARNKGGKGQQVEASSLDKTSGKVQQVEVSSLDKTSGKVQQAEVLSLDAPFPYEPFAGPLPYGTLDAGGAE